MRLFVALDIDENIRSRIASFVDSMREFAPDARWVRPESLHITLKFIGERSEEKVDSIEQVLGTVAASIFDMNFRGYGFFPSAHAPRIFWAGIEAGPDLTSLATVVDAKLAALDIPTEEHNYNAHLTLARSAGGSGSPRKQKGDGPNRSFQRLPEKLAALPAPEFGTTTAREFFLYQSQLSPGGSKYTKLARFALH
jgi:RNA 2',3'-cyclic 3'-phosphodiesterase